MKKNSEYKKKIAIKRYLDGEKVKQIAGAMKISTSTVYSWIRQYYLSYYLSDYFARNNKVAKFYFIVDRLDLLLRNLKPVGLW